MVEINNLTKEKISKDFLKKIVRVVLKGENRKEADLSIALVSETEIKKLNKKYRKKNKPTDVLSFEGVGLRTLGEIVPCPAQIKKNAKKFGNSFKKELTRVLIHGILHLLGYDHEKSRKGARIMEEKSKKYLNNLKLNH